MKKSKFSDKQIAFALQQAETGTPGLARVTGLVWGWPSDVGCIVATPSEYVRRFLLTAPDRLLAASAIGTRPQPTANATPNAD